MVSPGHCPLTRAGRDTVAGEIGETAHGWDAKAVKRSVAHPHIHKLDNARRVWQEEIYSCHNTHEEAAAPGSAPAAAPRPDRRWLESASCAPTSA